MLKRLLFLLTISIFIIFTSITAYAAVRGPLGPCDKGDTCQNNAQGNSFTCQPDVNADGTPKFDAIIKTQRLYACLPVSAIEKIFGVIEPPAPLKGFLEKDPTGAGAISTFLSNFVTLLFSIAAIVLVLMLVWGALEWMLSGGDKEKLASARGRIINAIIGLVLFASAFAIIRLVGTFTGFTFFAGQNGPSDPKCTYNNCGVLATVQTTSIRLAKNSAAVREIALADDKLWYLTSA